MALSAVTWGTVLITGLLLVGHCRWALVTVVWAFFYIGLVCMSLMIEIKDLCPINSILHQPNIVKWGKNQT